MIANVWLIPLIMLAAALVNGLGCRKLGKIAGYVTVAAMGIAAVISFLIFGDVRSLAHQEGWHGQQVLLWDWFTIGTLKVQMAFWVDQLTSVFLCFVSFIGFLVFLYATGYMKESHDGHDVCDPGYARFFAYLALFAAAMFTLVLGDNFVVMFIGWEGVGLCSYLLIGYFFDKPFSATLSCADAGRKAFVMNRIGDLGLILGVFLLFWGTGSVNFREVIETLKSSHAPVGFTWGAPVIMWATLCLFLGATGKSAQIPLFVWLPDAMAGPTPVSALIHAATMVTAGVYMVARLNVLFFLSPVTMTVIAIIGGFTAFAAASMGLTQRGIKKVLAYSTVSQLGYMFLALGVGSIAGGIFHVFTHAFFKGCLFLCAGSIIHAMHHEEDLFKYGGLRKYMPITHICYLCATLAIAGFPLTSGFFSKDEILFHTYISSGSNYPILYMLGVITAVLTAIYMGRSYFLAFWGELRSTPGHGHGHDDHGHDQGHDQGHGHSHGPHESPINMTLPLVVLAAASLLVGFLNVPAGMSGSSSFHHFLAPVTDEGARHVEQFVVHGNGAGAHEVATHHAKGGEKGAKAAEHGAGEMSGPAVLVAATSRLSPAATMEILEAKEKDEISLAVVSGLLAIAGLMVAGFFWAGGLSDRAKNLATGPLSAFYGVSANCWYWDQFYNAFFKDGCWALARGIWLLDMYLVDGAVLTMGRACREVGAELRRLQNGQVQNYALVMILGVCMFLIWFVVGMQEFLNQALPGTGARKAHHAPAVSLHHGKH